MALNPAIPKGVIAASTPPAIMASAWPSLTRRNAMPIALAPAAQAVTGQLMGPLAPYRMEICPAARLGRTAGMVKGERRLGPLRSRTACSFSMV